MSKSILNKNWYFLLICIMLLVTGSTFGASIVGNWRFSESSETTAADSSGKGNTGTLVNMNTPTCWVTGKYGNGLQFDGTNDYVDCGNGNSLNLTKTITVEAWIKCATDPRESASSIVVTKGVFNDSDAAYFICLYKSNSNPNYKKIQFGVGTSNNVATIDMPTDMQDKWYHIVGTYDKNAASNQINIYLNGVKGTSGTYTNTIPTEAGYLAIGRNSTSSTYYFNGVIDEVKIYDYALSAQEAYDHYLGSKLRAKWSFSETQGSTTADSSVWGNTGTLAGDTCWVTGKFGKSLQFDGWGDFVNCGTDSSLDLADAVTVEAWIKCATDPRTSSNSVVLTKGVFNDSDAAYFIYLSSTTDKIQFGVGTSNNVATIDMPSDMNGKWYHIVGTYDKNAASDQINIYLDGVKGMPGNYATAMPTEAGYLAIGRNSTNSSHYFTGAIDEVGIYSYALSPEEARAHYLEGNIRGKWSLDDGTGTTATDSSPYGNNGTLAGDTCWVAGKSGKGLQFDGWLDYVNCGTDSSLDLTDTVTVEAWIKCATNPREGNGQIVLTKGVFNDGDAAYFIYLSSSTDKICFGIGTSNNVATIDMPSDMDGKWYHIVGTYDKNAASNQINIYLNGVKGTPGTYTNTIPTETGYLAIGRNSTTSSHYFTGVIDDVRIYDCILSQEDINLQYLCGKWNLNDSQGTKAIDSSFWDNTGTLYSDACWVTDPRLGTVLKLDGWLDYVDCGNDSSLNLTDAVTVEAWVKCANDPKVSSNSIVVTKGVFNDADAAYFIYLSSSSDKIMFGVGTSNNVAWINMPSDMNGKWYHIVGTYDKNAASNQINIYLDGIKGTPGTYTGNIPTETGYLALGRNSTNSSNYFNGCISRVNIYSRALSEDEVYQSYCKTANIPTVFVADKTLNESYAYSPDYPHSPCCAPGFDSLNRPYIRTATSVMTLRNGAWDERNYRSYITAAYPTFSSNYTGGVDGYFNDSEIVFDANDNAYMFLAIQLSDSSVKSLLLFSKDYCETWTVHELPGGDAAYCSHAYEHPFSASVTLQGPPPILRLIKRADFPAGWHEYYYRWSQAYYYIYLIQPTIDGNGDLVMGSPIQITDNCIGWAMHSGGPTFCVTKNNNTYIVWSEVKPPINPPNIEAADNDTPIYIACYNHATQTLSDKVKLIDSDGGSQGICDVHTQPGICMDSDGYLHVIARPGYYTKSQAAESISSGWTTPAMIDPTCFYGYPTCICDADDNLHLSYELYYTPFLSPYRCLYYQKKPKNGNWETRKILIMPAYTDYANYYHKMAIDKNGRLFVTSPGYYCNPHPTINQNYSCMLTSAPDDEPWVFASTEKHFTNSSE